MKEQEDVIYPFLWMWNLKLNLSNEKGAPKARWKLYYFRGTMYYRSLSYSADNKQLSWKYFIVKKILPKKANNKLYLMVAKSQNKKTRSCLSSQNPITSMTAVFPINYFYCIIYLFHWVPHDIMAHNLAIKYWPHFLKMVPINHSPHFVHFVKE